METNINEKKIHKKIENAVSRLFNGLEVQYNKRYWVEDVDCDVEKMLVRLGISADDELIDNVTKMFLEALPVNSNIGPRHIWEYIISKLVLHSV
jgi:hypothetical protein